jgi:hypothetical protein
MRIDNVREKCPRTDGQQVYWIDRQAFGGNGRYADAPARVALGGHSHLFEQAGPVITERAGSIRDDICRDSPLGPGAR